jgi:hypothetical protein
VRVQVPDWGCWWADVDLAEDTQLSGAVTLTLADKTLSGTIVSGGAYEGRAAYRIVGGGGGWGRTLDRKAYLNDAGVKMSNVIGDAAAAAGESVEGAPATRLGSHYVRLESTASHALNQLTPRAWRVDFDGITRFGARATVAYTGEGARSRVEPGGGVVEIATDVIETLLPGVTIDGSAPATDVEYLLDSKRLTVRVYAGTRTSRRLAAWKRIFEALFPDLKYRGSYEFRVVTQTGERFNLQPVRAATGMPELSNVPVRPGVSGARNNVTLGELVLVVFADADPSRPQVTSHEAPGGPGWLPLTLELGGPGALGVARQTDAVVAGPFGGTIVGGSVRVKAAL